MELSFRGSREPLAPCSQPRLVVLLLAFIFFAEFLPSEAFLVDFLVSKGFHPARDIFPLYVYIRLPALLVIGLLAERFGGTPILVLSASCGCLTEAMTRFSTTLLPLQVTQLTVALSTAGHTSALWAAMHEVSCIMEQHEPLSSESSGNRAPFGLQTHVHYLKATLALANCLAGMAGSFLHRSLNLPLPRLWEISLCSQIASLLTVTVLAWRVRSARGRVATRRPSVTSLLGPSGVQRLSASFLLPGILTWTVWHITTHTGHLTVATYWQALLREKVDTEHPNNGYANAVAYFGGVVALLGTARLSSLGQPGNRGWIVGASLLSYGVLIFLMGAARDPWAVWQVYGCYVCFQILFRLGAASRTQQVIGALARESDASSSPNIALLFSVTDLLTAALQAVVQFVLLRVSQGHASNGTLGWRFEVLGVGIGLISLVFIARACLRL